MHISYRQHPRDQTSRVRSPNWTSLQPRSETTLLIFVRSEWHGHTDHCLQQPFDGVQAPDITFESVGLVLTNLWRHVVPRLQKQLRSVWPDAHQPTIR